MTTTTETRRLPQISEKLAFFITTFGAQALRILTALIMARLVSPKSYGLLALVLAIPGVISDLGDLGITRALVVIRDEPIEVLEDVGLVLTAGVYLIYLALGIIGGICLAHHYADSRLIVLGCITGITLYIGAIYNFQLTILNRAMRFRAESFQNIIFAVAQAVTGISLSLAGLGVFALALQPLAAQLVANITMRRHYRFRWPKQFQIRVARRMLNYGGRVTIAQYANNVRDTFINLVVGSHVGPAGLGIFGRAGQVKDLFGHNIITAIDRLLNPTMTAAREDLQRMRSLFVRGVIAMCLICWLGWAGFAANAHNLILVMLGHTWIGVAPILIVMSLDLLTTPFVVSAILLTHTLGLPMLWLRFTLVSAVLLIPFVLFTAHFEIAGGADSMMWWIAMATILAQNSVGLAFFGWAAYRLQLDIQHLVRRLLPLVAATALSFTVMFMLSHHSPLQKLPAIVPLAIASLAGCPIYAGIIWLFDSQTVMELKQLAFERKKPASEPAEPTDFCPECGYDLRATPETCPECGQVFKSSNRVEKLDSPLLTDPGIVLPTSQVACPICGSTAVFSVKQIGKYSIMSCGNCTLGFTHPPCEPQNHEAEYIGKDNHPDADRNQRTTLAELPKFHRQLIYLQAETITSVAPKGGRVLDIGSGEGLLMDLLVANGLRCQGIEPSVEAGAFAIKAGLNIVRGHFPHADVQGPFHVVNMSHVLEHIADPRTLLRDVAAIAPGGYLVLSQTNYRGFIPRTFAQWHGWCPEGHFWHFTSQSLRRILDEAGYTFESVRQISMSHESRRHKYILKLLDKIPNGSDQFILVSRIPEAKPAPSAPGTPVVSAVINYYNPKAISRIEATIALCIEALKEFSANPVEIICSDGSGVESATVRAMCEKLGAIYTLSPKPQNYAAIFNHGMSLAKGDYIAVLENDIFVHRDWDAKMLGEMKRTGASLAVPYLTSCDVITQQSGFVFRRGTFEPSTISQNLMLFDRQAYGIAFPMDEQFNGAFNDNDTYLRLRAGGKRIIVCDGGGIVHYRRSSQVYNAFSYDADVAKFRAKYPQLKYWDKFWAYSLADPLFIRSRPYRFLMWLAASIPSKRWSNFFVYHLLRLEPTFQPL